MLLVIAVTIAGFWESYFSTFTQGPWQFHAHGVAASIWVVLVATQSWTAQRRQFGWHAAAGKASLLLFPFLIAGLAAIIDSDRQGLCRRGCTARGSCSAAPSWSACCWRSRPMSLLYYRALKYRRKRVASFGLYAGDAADPVGIAAQPGC